MLKENNFIFPGTRQKENIFQKHNESHIVNASPSTNPLAEYSEYSDPDFEYSSDELEEYSSDELEKKEEIEPIEIENILEPINDNDKIFEIVKQEELSVQYSCEKFLQVQTEIKPNHREIAVCWLIRIHYTVKLSNTVLFNSIAYLDILFSNHFIPKKELQVYAAVCYWISAKVDTRKQPQVSTLNELTGENFTKEQFARIEVEILKVLNFKLSFPTSKLFLKKYLLDFEADYEDFEISRLISEISLMKFEFMNIRPSVIALSAAILTFASLNQSDKAIKIASLGISKGVDLETLKKCLYFQKTYSGMTIKAKMESKREDVRNLLKKVNLDIDIELLIQSAKAPLNQ